MNFRIRAFKCLLAVIFTVRSWKYRDKYSWFRYFILTDINLAISKMAFGNQLGVRIEEDVKPQDLFAPEFGNIIAEVPATSLHLRQKKLK